MRGVMPAETRCSIPPGLHHFRKESPELKTRLHLRIDSDGCGTLVINANSILHLNPTAAYIAYFHLEGRSEEEIRIELDRIFDIPPDTAAQDIELITRDLKAFINANGKPVNTFSGVEINAPYSLHPTAPYRMDLAITYRCNNDCPHCYNARLRSYPELSTDDWKKIIDRLWDLSIPPFSNMPFDRLIESFY